MKLDAEHGRSDDLKPLTVSRRTLPHRRSTLHREAFSACRTVKIMTNDREGVSKKDLQLLHNLSEIFRLKAFSLYSPGNEETTDTTFSTTSSICVERGRI